MEVKKYDIYWVNLNPSQGAEINKIRPCVIVSPNELNRYLKTVIVAPMTTKIKGEYPFRLNVEIKGKNGQIALDQIRSIDKARLQSFFLHIEL